MPHMGGQGSTAVQCQVTMVSTVEVVDRSSKEAHPFCGDLQLVGPVAERASHLDIPSATQH